MDYIINIHKIWSKIIAFVTFNGFFVRKTVILRKAHQVSVFLLVAPSALAEFKSIKRKTKKENEYDD